VPGGDHISPLYTVQFFQQNSYTRASVEKMCLLFLLFFSVFVMFVVFFYIFSSYLVVYLCAQRATCRHECVSYYVLAGAIYSHT
jgi:hypothetical protein